jgi:hypothetical protein
VAITDVLQKKFVSTSSSAQTATNQPEKPSLLRTVSASALKKPAAALTPSQVTTPLTPPATISTPVASTTTEPIAAESAAAAGKLVSAAKGGVIRNAVDQGSQIPVVDTSFGASFKSSFFNLLGIKSETTQLPTTVQEQLPQVVANLNVDQLAKVVEKNEEEREKGKLEKDEETLVSAELGEKLKKRADSAEKISQQTVTKEESAEKQTEQISTITSDPVIIPTVKKKTEEQIALELFAKKTTKLLEKLKLYLPELVSLSNDISEGKFQESKPFLAYVFKQCNSFIDPELNLFWSKLRVILKRYEGISSDAAVSSAVAFYHDFDFQGKSQLLQLFQSCSFLANDTLMMGAVSGYYATNMDKETLKTLWEKANKAEATQNSKDKLFEKFIDECLNKNYFNDVAQEVLKEIFPEKFESAPTLGSP